MVKYNQPVSQLIARLKKQPEIKPIKHQNKQFISCRACNCAPAEHKQYIYCGLIDDFLCRVCCCYDLYNDYQLVNKLLKTKVFTADEEVRLVCDEYCSADWEKN